MTEVPTLCLDHSFDLSATLLEESFLEGRRSSQASYFISSAS
jgi:hypothetical protein